MNASTRWPRTLTAAALAVAFGVAGAAGPASGPTLTFDHVAVDGTYSTMQGINASVARDAAIRLGFQIEFKPLPPLRSVEAANDGDIDGAAGRIADVAARYNNLIRVPTPVGKATATIYATTPDIAEKSRADIERLRICKFRGQFLTAKHSQGMQVTDTSEWKTMIQMLRGGRCDAMMVEYFDAAPYLIRERVTGIYRWPYAWAVEPMYLLLNKKHEALVPRFDAALRQMNQEGLIDRAYTDAQREFRIDPPPGNEPAAR